jgi:hypothetical protein
VPAYRALDALDALLPTLPGVGTARRRQLGMVREELAAALRRDALPVPARRSLQRLLADDALRPYVRLAESGALRKREVWADGERCRPPTAAATNAARVDCLDLLRQAVGLPPLDLAPAEPVELRPTPEPDRLLALRRRLGDDLGRDSLPDGQVRFTAVVAMVLDTGARSGELVDQHLAHLA